MDEQLSQILVHTYNPDPNLRAQAEAALKQFLAQPGALTYLLQLARRVDIPRDLRMAAGIVAKNNVRQFLVATAGPERESVKAEVLEALFPEADAMIRGITVEIMSVISEVDYPQRWPALLPSLIANLQSSEPLIMCNSLYALYKLMKRYEFKQSSERGPLNDTIAATFPYLQALLPQVVQHNSLEAAEIMKICFKIFHSCSSHSLPQVSGIDVNLWFSILSFTLDKRLPEASENLEPFGQPTEPDARKAWVWWKLKKWTSRVAMHFINKYGNPKYTTDEHKAFASHFRTTFAHVLLGPVMNTLMTKARGEYLSEEVHRQCLQYMCSAIELSPTYKLMKPHLEVILNNMIFPCLCLSESDIELFTDDPTEFVRKINDIQEDWLDPRTAAINLLQSLGRYRQKDTMPLFLPFLDRVLTEYTQTDPASRNYRNKDAVLVSFATLFKIMSESPKYAPMLEPFVVSHIIPEFQSPVPYIRARACWVVEYFEDVEWTNPSILPSILQGLLAGLQDPTIPVQTAAAVSLRTLIAAEGAQDTLRPMLPQIITEYFRIINESESPDSVLTALQSIIDTFGNDIIPMAPAMVDGLISVFQTYSNDQDHEDLNDDDVAFSASQALDTIMAVIDACQDNEPTMRELERRLLPTMARVVSGEGACFEYLDTILEMMSFFSYAVDQISPELYSFCGPLLVASGDWAEDYLTNIMVPLLNFISKNPTSFLSGSYMGTSFIDMLMTRIVKALRQVDDYDSDAKACCVLLASLVASSKGQLNPALLPLLLNELMARFLATTPAPSATLRIRLSEAMLAIMYHDTGAFLRFMAENPMSSSTYFTALFNDLPHMERLGTQRFIVIAFSSLMTSPPNLLPPEVVTNIQSIFTQIIRELVAIEAKTNEEEPNDDDNGDDDDDDDQNGGGGFGREPGASRKALDIPAEGYDEDDDCENAEDECYLHALDEMDKHGGTRKVYRASEAFDDDDDDDLPDCVSSIDEMNILQYFMEAMGVFSTTNPALVQTLQQNLDQEDAVNLQSLIAKFNSGASI